ncbi:prolipoprotein diacylglyceryl transferase [Hahella sp. CR1]|uniref:prolipoprotein diacylglyceryl transferase n=1 Tax=Hahella sp. CR1 TaxID=2992807 RepID=UPI00244302A0|nr:prolipoprotein diacylglyceryl transferase [Hahella sp. CR1]MDG9670720.1 prolipoprotein diacylglyceryl transferase [Hahella sp. CR1]
MTERWFDYPNIDPVAFAVGPLSVHWYGLMYLLGFAAAWMLGKHRSHQPHAPMQEQQVADLIFWCALGVVLGGRVGYVIFYNFEQFLDDPIWLFEVWTGGMSFHGGLIGVIIAMWAYGRSLGLSFFQVADFVAPLVPIGLGAGRLGNFIGGELWGRASDVPWAMVFPRDPTHLARHPSQLYQFALEGVALFLILWFYSAKPRPRMTVSGLFLLCYGCFRFLVEFVREPDAQLGYLAWGWLTMGQVLSTPMIVIGVAFIIYGRTVYGAEAKAARS